MVKFSDLSNELVLMIWDLIELEDLCSFSTVSKNVYLLTHDLLREHYKLGASSIGVHHSPFAASFGVGELSLDRKTSSGHGNHSQSETLTLK